MRSPIRGRRAVLAFLLVTLCLAALVLFAPALYDVQDKGTELVPYDGAGAVYQLRVLDSFTVYADGESAPNPDKLTSAGLVAAAAMTLMTALLLYAAGSAPRLRRFYGWATAGLLVLAADELFALHQSVGHNLQFLADLPGVERPDDVLFLLNGVAIVVFAWVFRDILFSNRRATRMLVAGGAFFAIAAAGDLIGSGVEEPAEVAAGICLLAGLVTVTVGIVGRELGLGATAAAAAPKPRRQRRATWTTQTVRGRPSYRPRA